MRAMATLTIHVHVPLGACASAGGAQRNSCRDDAPDVSCRKHVAVSNGSVATARAVRRAQAALAPTRQSSRIRARLHDEFGESLSLEGLARDVGLSKFCVARCFE